MIKIKQTVTVLVLLFVSQMSLAQFGSQQKGDYYFNQFSYSKAIVEYEKMISNDYKTDYAHERLAECYLLVRDVKKAIPHFQHIIHGADISSDMYFKYGMALYSIGDKAGAAKWLKKYKKYNKNDSRVKSF